MAGPQRPEAQDNPPLSGVTLPAQEPRFDEAEFLRRTFDRSLQEMERSRTFFERLLKWIIWAVVAMVTIGVGLLGFLGFRSWSDIQTRTDSELKKTKEAIVAQGERTISETDNIIRENAAEIFKEESIKSYVREVAKEKTERELSGIIQRTVNNQVAARIKAEGPQIKDTVVIETKRAVADLSPFISSEVKSEVQKQSTENFEPLRQQVKNYQAVIEVSALALLARNGDGEAYDQISQIAATTKDPGIKAISMSTYNQIYLDMNQGFYSGKSFKAARTIDEMKTMLDDPNAMLRWAAVDGLSDKKDKNVVPILINMINRDKSMWVRRAAYEALKNLTGQPLNNFQQEQWNKWWEQNKTKWPQK